MINLQNNNFGFTLVELIIAIAAIALLATIGTIGYANVQERTASTAVLSTLRHGSELLETNYNKSNDYPPNLAGTEFVATDGVMTTLYTNAPHVRVHSNLTSDENVQLFMNSCNANMPIYINGNLYNTGCVFAGNSVNIHVDGQRASNFVMKGATIHKDKFDLTCGPDCDAIQQLILDQFAAQGGTWPLIVSRNRNIPLPEPDTTVATGNATKFCLEGRYDRFPSMTIWHIKSNQSTPQPGPCPDDPDLNYIPENDEDSEVHIQQI